MKQIHKITKTVAALVLILAGLSGLSSCRKIDTPATKGGSVLFSARLNGSESGTKTAYDATNSTRIKWLDGDQIRIWSAECSEPTLDTYGTADHWADYTVTPESTPNQARIAVKSGTVGLRWGEKGVPHHFYAVYPSPGTTGKSDSGNFGESETPKPFTFTGHIPATQTISGDLTTGKDPENDTKNLTIAAPDMTNLYMVSTAEAIPKSAEKGVFLNFTPLSTAIQFTIENGMAAEGAIMKLNSVTLKSDASNIAGAFRTTLSDEWTTPPTVTDPAGAGVNGGYDNPYPDCTELGGDTNQSKAITINLTNTSVFTEGIAEGNRLQFTFFLLPTQSFSDLSIVLKFTNNNDETKNIKLRLADADGNAITFPKHKKINVNGILVPDEPDDISHTTNGILVPDDSGYTLKLSYTIADWGSLTGPATEMDDFPFRKVHCPECSR